MIGIKIVFLFFLLSFNLSLSFAGDLGFYRKQDNIEARESNTSNFSLFNKDRSQGGEEYMFDLYGETPLKAPPGGGGNPIGGVTPVSDGVLILVLLLGAYAYFRYRRELKHKI